MLARKKLEEFIEENLNGIYRFSYTYMRNKEDAEDVVSESVIKALKGYKHIKNEESIKCWFYTIVANTSLTALKRRGRCIAADTEILSNISVENDYSHLNFESMINSFDEEIKAIVVLKCCDCMTFGEIAKVLGVNENTVKTRFYAAMKKLRKEI